MGTQVDLERLAETLGDYQYAYLMTTNADGRPHAVAVRTALVDRRLRASGFGWRSRDNARNQHIVALVYPPVIEGGYSLIVDGDSVVRDDLLVTPTVAVLHRPPRPEDPPPESGCLSDCQRLEHE